MKRKIILFIIALPINIGCLLCWLLVMYLVLLLGKISLIEPNLFLLILEIIIISCGLIIQLYLLLTLGDWLE